MPDLGPLANHLISFAILKREPASPFRADDSDTIESWPPKASNLFFAVIKGKLVISAISLATSSAKPS